MAEKNVVERKRVRKLFFVWGEQKEAAWLRKMSNQGWHLVKASLGKYHFEKGEPGDFVYQFDFSMKSTKDEAEYLKIFREAGWEFINRLGGWYYFRKPYLEGELNEIYSDRESLKQKYRKLLFFLFLTGFPLIYNFFIIFRVNGRTDFYRYFWFFNGFILIMWLYAFIRTILYMRTLTKWNGPPGDPLKKTIDQTAGVESPEERMG